MREKYVISSRCGGFRMIAFFQNTNENRFSIKNLVLSVAFAKGFLLKGQKLFF